MDKVGQGQHDGRDGHAGDGVQLRRQRPRPRQEGILQEQVRPGPGDHAGADVGQPPEAIDELRDEVRSLRALVQDMQAGRVALLLVTSVNPVFSAPADVPFADALGRVKLSAHLGLYRDETAARTTWHIPEAHYLESWSDARAYDGTVTILQPLIAPLYQGRSALEIAATLAGKGQTSAHALVREYWKGRNRAGDFEAFWETALHDGSVPGTAAAPKQVEPRPDWRFPERAPEPGAGLELVFRPDPTVWDGSFANNGWLQELPKSLTKLTWSNAALLSPRAAERLALASGDEVELRYRGRVLRAPVWILPGHADDSVTLHLGGFRSLAICRECQCLSLGQPHRLTSRCVAYADSRSS